MIERKDFDNQFNDIVNELSNHMDDPYLESIKQDAFRFQMILNTQKDQNLNPFLQREMINSLNDKWRYMGQKIIVTGKAWIRPPGGMDLVEQRYIGEEVISRGFVFFNNNGDDSDDTDYKIGHFVDVADNFAGKSSPAVLPIDDIDLIELPNPSAEARVNRFKYYFADKAQLVDDLAFTSKRADQLVYDLREFDMDVDFDDENDLENLRDAIEYIKSKADIEPEANYQISFTGDVIFVDESGSGYPVQLNSPYTKPMAIKDIVLRPADIRAQELSGKHKCVPYIDVKAFKPDGKDVELLIPCTSILWMRSVRYESQP